MPAEPRWIWHRSFYKLPNVFSFEPNHVLHHINHWGMENSPFTTFTATLVLIICVCGSLRVFCRQHFNSSRQDLKMDRSSSQFSFFLPLLSFNPIFQTFGYFCTPLRDSKESYEHTRVSALARVCVSLISWVREAVRAGGLQQLLPRCITSVIKGMLQIRSQRRTKKNVKSFWCTLIDTC